MHAWVSSLHWGKAGVRLGADGVGIETWDVLGVARCGRHEQCTRGRARVRRYPVPGGGAGVECTLGKAQGSLEEGAQRHLAGGLVQLDMSSMPAADMGTIVPWQGCTRRRSDLHAGAGSLLQRCSMTNSAIVHGWNTG